MSIDYMLVKHQGPPDLSYANTVPMGDPSEIRDQISCAFPGTDWCNHARADSVGDLSTDQEGMEFCLTYEKMVVDWMKILAERRAPTEEEVLQGHMGYGLIMTIAVHFRRGNNFVPRLRALCERQGWTAWDLQTGNVFDFSSGDQHENHVTNIGNMIERLHSGDNATS